MNETEITSEVYRILRDRWPHIPRLVAHEMAEAVARGVEIEPDENKAVRLVAESYSPSDVYDHHVLVDWARASDPDEIFEEPDLREWAIEHGFKAPEKEAADGKRPETH